MRVVGEGGLYEPSKTNIKYINLTFNDKKKFDLK
jgi:hypothetical protein